ncbi:MtrB/PioB family outer membrane beta-barrel protein, partial [Shewanella sp. SG41-4]|uniref:MtrB/PioB family outer membrane beta-barrel protein n=1 Tax=Shewanella sp. SG41-4 TaxID=2760976 RepID=UPI0016030687
MNTKLNLITLALLTSTSFSLMADGYGLANAKTDNIKYDAWNCKACAVETGTTGNVGVGIGYNSEDDIQSANAFNSSNQTAGKVDADIKYRSDNGYQVKVVANNMCMDNGRMEIVIRKLRLYCFNLGYRSISTYQRINALFPYLNICSFILTLSDNWVTACLNSDMPMLYISLTPFVLSLRYFIS